MSGAPVEFPNPRPPEDPDDEEMPRVHMTRRRFVLGVLLIVIVVAILYYGIPRLAGLDETWHRIEQGDPWWLALALVFTVLSFGGYVVLFEYVFAEDGTRLGLRIGPKTLKGRGHMDKPSHPGLQGPPRQLDRCPDVDFLQVADPDAGMTADSGEVEHRIPSRRRA